MSASFHAIMISINMLEFKHRTSGRPDFFFLYFLKRDSRGEKELWRKQQQHSMNSKLSALLLFFAPWFYYVRVWMLRTCMNARRVATYPAIAAIRSCRNSTTVTQLSQLPFDNYLSTFYDRWFVNALHVRGFYSPLMNANESSHRAIDVSAVW